MHRWPWLNLASLWRKQDTSKEVQTHQQHVPDSSMYDQMLPASDKSGECRRALSSASNKDFHTYLSQHGYTVIEPRGRDILAKWLFSSNWLRLLICEVVLVIVGMVPVFVAYSLGLFTNTTLRLDAAHDLGYWNHITSTCAMVMAISLYQARLPRVLFDLCFLGVCKATPNDFNQFARSSNDVYRKRWLTWLPYMFALCITVAGIFAFHLTPGFWHSYVDSSRNLLCGLLQLPFCFLTYYIAAFVLLRIGASYRVLQMFFKLKPDIDPLHADGCGGLYPLGSLAMRLNLVVFAFGIIIAVGLLFDIRVYGFSLIHPVNLLIMAAYVAAAVVIFFLPLYAARPSMCEAKLQALQDCARTARRLTKQVMKNIEGGQVLSSEQKDELDRVASLHERVNAMPVYPFNTRIVRSFLGSLLTPLGLVLIEVILKNLL